MHLADAFIQSDLHCIQVTVSTFCQVLLSLGIEPMILALASAMLYQKGKLIIYLYLYLEYIFYIMYFSFLYFYFQEVELCLICGLKYVMTGHPARFTISGLENGWVNVILIICSINNTFYFNSFYDPDHFLTITILLSRIQI